MKTSTFIKSTITAAAIAIGCLSVYAATTTAKAPAKAKTVQTTTSEGKVVHLTKAEFDKLVCNTNEAKWKFIGDKPCVIDFYATWCGPCKMISPFLDEFAEKYKGQLNIYKIDVDKERELASMFGANSIPLLIFVPKQGEPSSQRGALDKASLETAIRTAVLGLKE